MTGSEAPRVYATENTTVDEPLPALRWPAVVIVLLLLGVLRIVVALPSRAHHNDFAHYYLSSRLLIDGAAPYRTPLEPLYAAHGFVFDARIPTATNPPPLLWLMAPFSAMSPKWAHWMWSAFNGLSLVACLVMIRRFACPDLPRKIWWFAVVAVVWSFPVFEHFAFSQVQLELAVLLLGAFCLQRRGPHGAACVLASVAAALKLFPVLMLPWFVFHSANSWREVVRRSLIVGAVLAVIVTATGLTLWKDFLQHGLPVISTGVMNQWGNQSVPSLVLNLASASREFALDPTTSRTWWIIASMVGVLLLAAAYGLIWLKRGDSRIAFGLLLVAMVITGTTAWRHYFVILIWPAMLALELAWKRPELSRRLLTGVMVLLLVIPVGDLLASAVGTLPTLINILLGYLPLAGALLLGALLAYSLDSPAELPSAARSAPLAGTR